MTSRWTESATPDLLLLLESISEKEFDKYSIENNEETAKLDFTTVNDEKQFGDVNRTTSFLRPIIKYFIIRPCKGRQIK